MSFRIKNFHFNESLNFSKVVCKLNEFNHEFKMDDVRSGYTVDEDVCAYGEPGLYKTTAVRTHNNVKHTTNYHWFSDCGVVLLCKENVFGVSVSKDSEDSGLKVHIRVPEYIYNNSEVQIEDHSRAYVIEIVDKNNPKKEYVHVALVKDAGKTAVDFLDER